MKRLLKRLVSSREVVTVVPARTVASSAETLALNRRLAELGTRQIPAVTR